MSGASARTEVFETPRTAEGSLATPNTSSLAELLAAHRNRSHLRVQEAPDATSRRLLIDVELRRVPRGEEARHFYFSLWSQAGDALFQLSEERLVAVPRDEAVFLHTSRLNSQRQRKQNMSVKSPSPRPAALVVRRCLPKIVSAAPLTLPRLHCLPRPRPCRYRSGMHQHQEKWCLNA